MALSVHDALLAWDGEEGGLQKKTAGLPQPSPQFLGYRVGSWGFLLAVKFGNMEPEPANPAKLNLKPKPEETRSAPIPGTWRFLVCLNSVMTVLVSPKSCKQVISRLIDRAISNREPPSSPKP